MVVRAFSRRPWWVAGAVLAVAAALALAAVRAFGSADARLVAGLAVVARRDSCPASDAPGATARSSGAEAPSTSPARGRLVPTGAISMLVCRYNGAPNPPPINVRGKPAFGLVASDHLAGRGAMATITRVVGQLNAIPDHLDGPVDCGAATGHALLLYLGYRPGSRDYRYTVAIDGCLGVGSGRVWRLALGPSSRVIGTLEALVPVRGAVAKPASPGARRRQPPAG
ncbi:MAG TPA: hypothetical protein VME01_04570 [Solirubrobacteraceae bacterium]|nr:hypothetical protein [Solirubrobacteraceae bacterium]